MFKKLVLYLKLIKFSHSIFALPFALAGAVIAASGIPSLETDILDYSCNGGREIRRNGAEQDY